MDGDPFNKNEPPDDEGQLMIDRMRRIVCPLRLDRVGYLSKRIASVILPIALIVGGICGAGLAGSNESQATSEVISGEGQRVQEMERVAELRKAAEVVDPDLDVEEGEESEESGSQGWWPFGGKKKKEGEDPDAKPEIEPGAIVVKGCGIWENRMLKKVIWLLLPEEGSRPEFLRSDFIEDAVYMMQADLEDKGYLAPSMEIELELESGEIQQYSWKRDTLLQLPRPLYVRKATFHVDRGVLSHYETITFNGLESISNEEADSYFRGAEFLIPQKSSRVYSPAGLDRGLANLEQALQLLGYADARATVESLERDTTTGVVNATILVVEGAMHRIRSTVETIQSAGADGNPLTVTQTPNVPFSKRWLAEWSREMRRAQYRQGYPETRIGIAEPVVEMDGDIVWVDLEATTEPGMQYELGEIRFTGNERTRERYLRKKVRLETGEPLDLFKVQDGRYELSKTGLFDSVRLILDDPNLTDDSKAADGSDDRSDEGEEDEGSADGAESDIEDAVARPLPRGVTYELKEARYTQVNLLAGYGTYELVRAGVEWEQRNLFGVAHSSRLRFVKAVRATRAQYDYSVPGLFGTPTDGFASLYARERLEPAFRRREVGGSIGIERPIPSIRSRVGVRYTQEYLDAGRVPLVREYGLSSGRVGSLAFNILHEARDNAMSPEKGHHLFSRAEIASSHLGGVANYQLFEVGGSLHRPLDSGRFLHFGFTHGIIRSQGNRSDNLPFNKRFFPGGENSIRGYQLTEASPLENDSLVGAEAYWLFSGEFEQALTPTWSLVLFSDTVGIAANLDDYPSTEILLSVGLGIRWKTVVGPVRLEYGHNVNPRSQDPSGTVLVSIGFPF